MTSLTTERLILRHWKLSDRDPFVAMSADPQAMEYLGGVWSPETADDFIKRANAHFSEYGFGTYALELRETGEFIGFTGIRHVPWDAHFTPAIEIGWRLAVPHWNKGYTTEAGKKVIAYAFQSLRIAEIVSFTTPMNVRSKRVMEKLGMRADPKDSFRHPRVPADDPLSEHVLYKLRKAS